MMECAMPARCCFWRVVHLVLACLMHQLVRCCFSAYTSKEKAYVSLVRPTLEYASSVWDPYQQNDIHRLEMV
jgi:hypothetical protein